MRCLFFPRVHNVERERDLIPAFSLPLWIGGRSRSDSSFLSRIARSHLTVLFTGRAECRSYYSGIGASSVGHSAHLHTCTRPPEAEEHVLFLLPMPCMRSDILLCF
ncbi:hypothetical protein NDU88_011106 [Pleurodeles waltl]|uniref:Uncharacterized protein n=1 Tax=Pleurodeles waltl TaxID=8319 RepID=A0AAV7Q0M7_PLEWA|nr:hypothetical protein NDU88_011106 [Pleurodeles waltl]